MTFSINFNGVELSNLVDGFTSIERDTGAGFTTNLQSSNGAPQTTRYGQDFLFNTINSKVIVVNYLINGTPADWVNKRNKISAALNVTEPSPLIFEDEPNKVWYAVADGNQTLVEDITASQAAGTITFLVPSGIAESTFEQTLNSSNSGGENGTITVNPDGSVNVQINNQGTLETYPTFTVTNSSENGYLGLVNKNGTLELGNKEEADGVTNPKSEVLYSAGTNGSATVIDPNFSKLIDATGQVNPAAIAMKSVISTTGSMSFQTDSGVTGLKISNYGTGSGINGGLKSYTLSADSNGVTGSVNFYAWMRFWAWAGAMGQTGVLQVIFTDDNDKMVAAYAIEKTDSSGNTATVAFYVGGDNPRKWKVNNFTSNNGEGSGNNNNTMFNSSSGTTDFMKNGGTLSFYWKGSRQSILIPELAEVEISKVFVYTGNFSSSALTRGMMAHLMLRELRCRKDNVPIWSDLPNRYGEGSEVIVDMENGKVFTDNISSNSDLVNGSEFFSIPVGKSEFDIYSSSWAAVPPKVEVTWKERYL